MVRHATELFLYLLNGLRKSGDLYKDIEGFTSENKFVDALEICNPFPEEQLNTVETVIAALAL